ncbi:MAG: LytR C-terminal domain-containing protein [Bacteroidetes bacterium]|nr:LytR C-terminal domain-containing protein [Bacteroidota bacterium]
MKNVRPRRVRKAGTPTANGSGRTRTLLIGAIALIGIPLAVLAFGFIKHSIVRRPVSATVERTDMFVKAGEHIQVDVVNSCGIDGLATKFTEFLRARKFDVPEYSTTKARVPYSKVIDRIGDPLSARKVAYALGIDESRIETGIDSSLYLRATVVIGMDYRTLRPMK